MSHFLVSDPTLFSSLFEFDTELAQETLAKGCPHCGHHRLHQSHYPRKPRGIEANHRALFSFRFSYCCAACRKRITCPSLRFLGRKIYVGLIVVLASCCQDRITAWFSRLAQEMNLSLRTLWRWRSFWTKTLPASRFWQAVKGRFMPPADPYRFPHALLETLGHSGHAIFRLLKYLSPLTLGGMISANEGLSSHSEYASG